MQNEIDIQGRPAALLPIAIFLVLYLGLGITFEYVLHIPLMFYPFLLLASSLVAIAVKK